MQPGRRLRVLRLKLGLQQKQAARRCRIAQSVWSLIENGKRRPNLDQAHRIAIVSQQWGERIEPAEWLTADTKRWLSARIGVSLPATGTDG